MTFIILPFIVQPFIFQPLPLFLCHAYSRKQAHVTCVSFGWSIIVGKKRRLKHFRNRRAWYSEKTKNNHTSCIKCWRSNDILCPSGTWFSDMFSVWKRHSLRACEVYLFPFDQESGSTTQMLLAKKNVIDKGHTVDIPSVHQSLIINPIFVMQSPHLSISFLLTFLKTPHTVDSKPSWRWINLKK